MKKIKKEAPFSEGQSQESEGLQSKYLFKKDNFIYKALGEAFEKIGDVGEVELTVEAFKEHGATDLSVFLHDRQFRLEGCEILALSKNDEINLRLKGEKDLFSMRGGQSSVLCLSSNEVPSPALRLSGFKDLRTLDGSEKGSEILVSADIEREDIPIAKPYGYTKPQLVLPTGDIRLDKVKSVNSMTIKANDEKQQNRIVYSVDSGKTWLSKQDGESIEIDIKSFEDIVSNGMTIEQFNSINKGWSNEILNSGKIRFGYYLDIEDIDDKTEVDQLEINISMYGGWDILNNGKEYKYGYTNEQLVVKLFKDGTYKVNYVK